MSPCRNARCVTDRDHACRGCAYSGYERATQLAHAEYRHDPLQVIGEHMQADLCLHRLEFLAKEVGGANPGFDGRAGVVSDFATDRQGAGCFHAGVYSLDEMVIPPTPYPTTLLYALAFQRAGRAPVDEH